MRDFLAYSQFEAFWDQFQPETPFGRSAKEPLTIHREAPALERIWDETEVVLALLQELESDPASLSRIIHHLKRLPRFPEMANPRFDEVEIFQFKKFLHNYKTLMSLLTPPVRDCFHFHYQSDGLERLLDTGRQSPESFFVADAFSAELADVRQEILQVNALFQASQRRRADEIQARWGILFGDRAFLIVPRALLGEAEQASQLLAVEPFDETRYSIRPLASGEALGLAERRSALHSQERLQEDHVLARISTAINQELANFQAYREIVTRFDLAFARARLAKDFQLVRPRFHGGSIEVTKGRFIPCEELCGELGTDYVPLDACFDTQATVVFGSNMGGKTVVLKTLAFLQLCAQTGLFVPADSFSTRLFQHFHYLGEGRNQEAQRGLSGFGLEIQGLVEAWHSFVEPTLVIFDEFARTTNSREAEAILSAVVESLASKPGICALFSTHFRGVARLEGVRYLRMKGLDRHGLSRQQDLRLGWDARIRLIDEHMEFHLVPDVETLQVADAIAVAELLGLAPEVAGRAEYFFNIESVRSTHGK